MSFFPCETAAAQSGAAPAIDWEESACPLCQCRRSAHVIEAPDHFSNTSRLWFAVVRCVDCGLCYTNPRPSPKSIGQFYPPDYWLVRAPGPFDRKSRTPSRKWFAQRNERKVLPLVGKGRLLDFGCGGGLFLDRMHRQGWKVTGVDISQAAVEQVRQGLGLPALLGTLPHPQFKPASFDVITMWHSLEHVHEPRETLRQAYYLLAPGGKLVVAVPNIASLPFRWFGRCWFALDLPRHLTHFTPRTLHWMLEGTGFQICSSRMVRKTSWLRSSARLACQARGSSFWQRCLTGKPSSRLVSFLTWSMGKSDSILVTAQRTD